MFCLALATALSDMDEAKVLVLFDQVRTVLIPQRLFLTLHPSPLTEFH